MQYFFSHLAVFVAFVSCVSSCSIADDIFIDDYGAVGDGVANDRDAIRSAISAASPGDRILFSAGKTYSTIGVIQVAKSGIDFVGNGATIKRGGSITSLLSSDAVAGATSVEVVDATDFFVGMEFTPVRSGGAYADGEHHARHIVSGISGNTVSFNTLGGSGLAQSYSAGDTTTNTFDTFQILASDVSFDNFVFDGNRSTNDQYVSWTRNRGVITNVRTTITNSVFTDMPGDAIVGSKYGFSIENNLFKNLNTSAVHFSGNRTNDGSTISFSNNVIHNSSTQADRARHSEGVITISAQNDHIRIRNNIAVDGEEAFIGNFHRDMSDWIIDGNMVGEMERLFRGSVVSGAPLDDIRWTGNFADDVGHSSISNSGTGVNDGWMFDQNTINDGTFNFSDLTDGSISLNVISADSDPLTTSDLNGTTVIGNELDASYVNSGATDLGSLIYNFSTGEVRLSGLGAPTGTFNRFFLGATEIDLNALNPTGADFEITSNFGLGQFKEDSFASVNLGAIFDQGLTPQEVEDAILFARWADSNGNYGAFSITTVPEPSSATIIAIACIMIVTRRKR